MNISFTALEVWRHLLGALFATEREDSAGDAPTKGHARSCIADFMLPAEWATLTLETALLALGLRASHLQVRTQGLVISGHAELDFARSCINAVRGDL